MLRVMSRRGDDRVTWDEQKVLEGDPEAAAAIREAERIFSQERAKGATAFRLDPGKPAQRIENLTKQPSRLSLSRESLVDDLDHSAGAYHPGLDCLSTGDFSNGMVDLSAIFQKFVAC